MNESYPLPISLIYTTPEPNRDVELYSGEVRIRSDGEEIQKPGTVTLRWLPSPKIEFHMPSHVFGSLALGDCDLDLVDRGWTAKASVTRRGNGGLKGEIDTAISGWRRPSASTVHSIRAHLLNFHQTYGEPLATETGWYSGRRELNFAEWRLTLDATQAPSKEAFSRLGGYGFTHALEIRKNDNSEFDPSSCEELISMLETAFSFALGRRTVLPLQVGFDSSDTAVWEHWRPFIADQNVYAASWFPNHREPALEAFVPAFGAATAADKATRLALQNCVHWYLEANACNGGLEGALVMIMIAFELLAWLELVNRRQCIAPDGFERMAASDKIRTYLSVKNVPICIDNEELPDLAAFIGQQKLQDGVLALTRIRNRAVHPPRGAEFPDFSVDLLQQAWTYALLLLERAILIESGYRGPMAKRVGWRTVSSPTTP